MVDTQKPYTEDAQMLTYWWCVHECEEGEAVPHSYCPWALHVLDLRSDENDGVEFSLILFSFPRNAFEEVIIDPSTF